MKRTDWLLIALLFCFSCREKLVQHLPYYNTPDFTPEWQENTLSNKHTIGAFQLMNQDGKRISDQHMAGRICVANFFFTTCGSICPKMMGNLKKLQKDFTASEVLILSHSVLPEVDSVARLKKYEERMGIDGRNWWLLTGNRDSIYRLARQSYFADEETGYNKDSQAFLHTENCVLVDKKGRIRGVYNATLPLEIDKLEEHIRLLQREEENERRDTGQL